MFEKQNGISNTFEKWLSIGLYINLSTPLSQYLKKKIKREF